MNDLIIASKYLRKAKQAKDNGYEFKLSFTSFKNLMRAKKCKATGLVLTDTNHGYKARFTDRTIDRIDNNKGYISGNVAVICSGANNIKSMFENQANPLTISMMNKITKFSINSH